MKKILIIEDETELREELEDILRYEGFKVTGTDSGKKGLQIARKEFPDLILCDIMMPEMSGFDVLRELKKMQPWFITPFIFITALTDRQDFRRGMETGADDYLTKPFSRVELLNAIHTRLEKSDNQETRIRKATEQLDSEIKGEMEGLKVVIKKQSKKSSEIYNQNKNIENQLKEMEIELMNEMIRVIITKNTLNSMERIIDNELKNNELSGKSRIALLNIRKKLKEKPIDINNWAVFQMKVNKVYPGFIDRLSQVHPALTQYDLVFIAAIKMGMNTKQVGELLNIADDSVRKSRYRIKQKLGLKKKEKIISYLHTIYPDKQTGI